MTNLYYNNNNNIQFLETHNTIKNSLYACEKVNINWNYEISQFK